MHKDLLLHPHIGSYSAMWLVAFAAAYFLTRWRSRKFGIEGKHVDNICLIMMLVAPFGARLFSRLFYYPTPLSFFEAFQVWKGGGLVFYGGLIFGVSSVIAYCLIRKVPMLRMGDLAAPGIALGLAAGRVGCFLAGCCWGDLCVNANSAAAISDPVYRWQLQTFPSISSESFPLAVQFPSDTGAWRQHAKAGLITNKANQSLPVHPTQLYEAALALALCIFLASRKGRRLGDVFWTFGMGYGAMRFAVEYLRADSTPAYWGLTISQVISLLIGLVCLTFYLGRRTASQVSEEFDSSPAPIPIKVN